MDYKIMNADTVIGRTIITLDSPLPKLVDDSVQISGKTQKVLNFVSYSRKEPRVSWSYEVSGPAKTGDVLTV